MGAAAPGVPLAAALLSGFSLPAPSMLHVARYHTIPALRPLAADWDGLTRGVPFRRFEWLMAWWRNYGLGNLQRELFTLCVFDQVGRLVGVAPWYVTIDPIEGRIVRFLGVEEICSDYLAVLCRPEDELAVAVALADWLSAPQTSLTDWLHTPHGHTWDVLHLDGVDAEDQATGQLIQQMIDRKHSVYRSPGPNCWRLPLAGDWDAQLADLSKARRKHVRRTLRRMVETPELVVHRVSRADEVARGLETLARLHQARWREAGEQGRFGAREFASFHREMAPGLLERGELSLMWLELDGRPIAADYHLIGHDVIYAYQGGVDPEYRHLEPGHMSLCSGIEWAMRNGLRSFDFLRGDEPYKASWGATARPSMNVRVVAPHALSQARHTAWWAGARLKAWVKSALKRSAANGETER